MLDEQEIAADRQRLDLPGCAGVAFLVVVVLACLVHAAFVGGTP